MCRRGWVWAVCEPGGLVRELLQESRAGVTASETRRGAVGIHSTKQFKVHWVTDYHVLGCSRCWSQNSEPKSLPSWSGHSNRRRGGERKEITGDVAVQFSRSLVSAKSWRRLSDWTELKGRWYLIRYHSALRKGEPWGYGGAFYVSLSLSSNAVVGPTLVVLIMTARHPSAITIGKLWKK